MSYNNIPEPPPMEPKSHDLEVLRANLRTAFGPKARKDELRREIATLQEELDRIESIPDEDYPEGTVLLFTKMFQENSTEYIYAMIKANGLWHTTGAKSPKAYTWEEIRTWLASGGGFKNLRRVTFSHVVANGVQD